MTRKPVFFLYTFWRNRASLIDMTKQQKQIISQLETTVRNLMATLPSCHDFDHTLRVRANARQLAGEEGGDLFIIECAALLHDIGRNAEFADQGQSCHAVVGAEKSPDILRTVGLDDETIIARITACVESHRYRDRNHGSTRKSIEEKIIFDADKLDAMGAIGIGRAFHFAGRIGARVHNAEKEALQGESYSKEDSAFREFLVKLQYLNDRMLTQEGRRLGEKRFLFMQDFFQRITREVAGEDY